MPLKAQRRRAITALITIIVSLTALVVPLVVMARAQGTPAIQIINPTIFEEAPNAAPIISNEPTGSDESESENETTFRLSAWTKNTPAEALVEFELFDDPDTTTIGTAERVGEDAFELNWDVNVDPGGYTLRAILYEGQPGSAEEVARDEIDVFVGGTAADLINWPNGGDAGFYTHPLTGVTNTLVDFEFSAGTNYVGVYYSVSDPGDEPIWKRCGSARVSQTPMGPAGAGRLRCVLESVDQGGQSVTGLAVVANIGPVGPGPVNVFDPNFSEAGDAIRISPYVQDAVSISVDPSTTRQDEPNVECSAAQVATVLDQDGQPIAGISADAHSTGPSDQTKFDTDTGNEAPDSNHTGDEEAWNCRRDDGDGTQAEHNRVATPDRKHVETAAIGNTGTWSIRLFADQAGETQITIWADEDDDDLFCTQEPAVAAAIGWDQPAPVPIVETPERSDCPIPVPPPPGTTGTSTTGTSTETTGTSTTSPPDDRGCTISGDDGDNVLEGTEGNDVICGNGGEDTIRGLGGDDIIHGDEGEDEVDGGEGEDTIDGGADSDALRGGSGNDVVRGRDDDDILAGGGGRDTLRGNAGIDTLRGSGGNDVLQGGSGNDIATGGGANDTLKGGSGKDILRGGGGDDVIRGGVANDQLTGGNGNDNLNGGRGRDNCRGGGGRDRLRRCER